jgi:hypothetical protein
VPYWDGCTSISRAARPGSGNGLFQALMLPSALLLAWLWWEARDRLSARSGVRIGVGLAILGTVGALALAIYVVFLGEAGEMPRWLRRSGAVLYFGSTFLAQLLFVRQRRAYGARDAALGLQLALCLLLLLGGLASTAASGLVDTPDLKDRIENAIEWWLGVLFTLWFLALAWRWRSGWA